MVCRLSGIFGFLGSGVLVCPCLLVLYSSSIFTAPLNIVFLGSWSLSVLTSYFGCLLPHCLAPFVAILNMPFESPFESPCQDFSWRRRRIVSPLGAIFSRRRFNSLPPHHLSNWILTFDFSIFTLDTPILTLDTLLKILFLGSQELLVLALIFSTLSTHLLGCFVLTIPLSSLSPSVISSLHYPFSNYAHHLLWQYFRFFAPTLGLIY